MIFRSQVYGMFDIWSTLSSCAYQVLRGGETTVMSSQYLRLSTAFQAGEKTDQLLAARGIMVLTSVPSKLRSTTRQFAQCYLILAHFKHSKFHAVYIHIYIYPDPSPGFSSRGEPKTRRGGHIFKIQYWIYVATGGPNVKWGGTDFKCGAGHHCPPRWRRPCVYRIALLTLGTLHCLCVCMVTQLHALRAQQNKHLLGVDFSLREHWF